MGPQEVHGGAESRRGVVLPDRLHAGAEVRRVAAPKVQERRRPERIVHEAVSLASQQVFPPPGVGDLVAAVLPDLAQEKAVRLGLVHGLANAGEEVIRQLVRHVQPPAVGPGPEPVADDGILPLINERLIAGLPLVGGGQVPDAPPGVVVRGPGMEGKPVVVGGVLALGGADGVVATLGVEVAAVPAVVVEDSVQNHPDAVPMGLHTELAEVLLCPQHGVNAAVVAGIVAVVGAGLKDGAEVQGLHPQLRKIRQLLPDAGQISAEEVPAVLAVLIRQIVRDVLPVFVEAAARGHFCHVRQPGAPKAVREDLIGEPLPKPAGGGGGGVVDRHLPEVPGFPAPAGSVQIPDAAVRPGETEGVPAELRLLRGRESHRKALPLPVPSLRQQLPLLLQPGELLPEQQRTADEALPRLRPDMQGNALPAGHRPEGEFAQRAAGIKHKGFRHKRSFSIANN